MLATTILGLDTTANTSGPKNSFNLKSVLCPKFLLDENIIYYDLFITEPSPNVITFFFLLFVLSSVSSTVQHLIFKSKMQFYLNHDFHLSCCPGVL